MSDNARTPKEAVYDEHISPLMARIPVTSRCTDHA